MVTEVMFYDPFHYRNLQLSIATYQHIITVLVQIQWQSEDNGIAYLRVICCLIYIRSKVLLNKGAVQSISHSTYVSLQNLTLVNTNSLLRKLSDPSGWCGPVVMESDS